MKNILLLFTLFGFLIACNTAPCPCPCPSPGVPVDSIPPPAPGKSALDGFIGATGFTWTRFDTIPGHRIYLRWDFIATAKGLFVQPISKSRTADGVGLDSYLAETTRRGQTVVLCVNQTTPWFWGLPTIASKSDAEESYYPHASLRRYISGNLSALSDDPDYPPVLPGKSRTDPRSYARFASDLGELAKRYGKTKHSYLRVDSRPRWTNDPPNQLKSGLNYNVAIEVWNEPDKWWKKGDGSGIYMEAEEYASMLSCAYDSIKAADPAMPVIMAGLTGFDLGYLQRMTAWFTTHRADKKFPADVITVHHYSNVGNRFAAWPPTWPEAGGCAPELDQDFIGAKSFVDYAKKLGLPLWVTEFGYDTRSPSPMYAKPIAGKTSEQLQAEWAVRSYLEYLRLGVDRAMIFNGNDEPGAINGGLYTNSGLLYGEGEPGKVFQPKPAFHAVNALARQLRGLTYEQDVSTGIYHAMQFRRTTDGKRVVAIWYPTAEGKQGPEMFEGKTINLSEMPIWVQL